MSCNCSHGWLVTEKGTHIPCTCPVGQKIFNSAPDYNEWMSADRRAKIKSWSIRLSGRKPEVEKFEPPEWAKSIPKDESGLPF